MRGYQKRVIYLKNTGSRYFEQAYFIMRENGDSASPSSEHMIDEANRIIKENFEKERAGFFFARKRQILAFLLGCAATALLFSLILFLL